MPREAQEEALELDAVVERRGREVLAPQSFVEGRGDGVRDPDYSGHDCNPRVAESINGLVTPSSKLARDNASYQVGRRRSGGDVAVSVTGWDARRRRDLAPVRDSRRRRDDAPPARHWGRRRNRSRCAEIHRISQPLRSLGVEQTKGWQARRPLEGRHRQAEEAHDLGGGGHRTLHSWLLRC